MTRTFGALQKYLSCCELPPHGPGRPEPSVLGTRLPNGPPAVEEVLGVQGCCCCCCVGSPGAAPLSQPCLAGVEVPGWGILEVPWQFLRCTLGPWPRCCSHPEKAAQHRCCLGAELGMHSAALLSELALNWGGKGQIGLLASRRSWKVVGGGAGCGLQLDEEEFGEGLWRGKTLPILSGFWLRTAATPWPRCPARAARNW